MQWIDGDGGVNLVTDSESTNLPSFLCTFFYYYYYCLFFISFACLPACPIDRLLLLHFLILRWLNEIALWLQHIELLLFNTSAQVLLFEFSYCILSVLSVLAQCAVAQFCTAIIGISCGGWKNWFYRIQQKKQKKCMKWIYREREKTRNNSEFFAIEYIKMKSLDWCVVVVARFDWRRATPQIKCKSNQFRMELLVFLHRVCFARSIYLVPGEQFLNLSCIFIKLLKLSRW